MFVKIQMKSQRREGNVRVGESWGAAKNTGTQ